MKDTDDNQPVSIEDEIASAIDSAEEVEDETEQVESEPESEKDDETESKEHEESPEELEKEDDGEVEDDAEADENPEEDSEKSEEEATQESEEDKLDAPEHWSASDRETFSKQPREAQDFILERHKSMEGDYTRKSQEFASDKRQFDAITDSLAPYQAEFQSAGLDNAGAVRQLASWHSSLKTGGKSAILQLAQMYNIDLTETDDQDTDPAVRNLQAQVSDLKTQTARTVQAAQQDKQNQLYQTIQAFQAETDENGLTHPHFETLHDDITRLFSAGIAKDLEDGYNKALMFRPDLVAKKPAPVVEKPDQAAIVKKAKKAATGVKKSGATSKISREKMTLEEEIASHM